MHKYVLTLSLLVLIPTSLCAEQVEKQPKYDLIDLKRHKKIVDQLSSFSGKITLGSLATISGILAGFKLFVGTPPKRGTLFSLITTAGFGISCIALTLSSTALEVSLPTYVVAKLYGWFLENQIKHLEGSLENQETPAAQI